jgi:hypothetical protein
VWDGYNFSVSIITPDWNGNATFKFKCHNSEDSFTSELIRIHIRPVNDAPSILPIPRFTATEDADSTLNVRAHLSDVDTPIDGLTVYTDEVHCTVTGHDLVFHYPTGGIEVEVTVMVSDGTLPASTTLMVTVLEVNDPPVVGPIAKEVRDEGTGFDIDLSDEISDEESPDDLLSLECDHPFLTGISGLELTFMFALPGDDVQVPFTVTDGVNRVEGVLVLDIREVNDPPTSIDLPSIFRLDEGAENRTPFGVVDEDDIEHVFVTEVSPKVLVSVVDGSLVIKAIKGNVGEFDATLTATDDSGDNVTHEFVVIVRNVNDPPSRPTLLAPLNHSTFDEGTKVLFSVSVDDPDLPFGEVLFVNWSSDLAGNIERLTSEDPLEFTTRDLPTGTHRVTVTVSDGEYSTEAWFEVTVKAVVEPGGEPPFWLLAILFLVIVAIAVVVIIGQSRATPVDEEEEAIAEEAPAPPVDEERAREVSEVHHLLMNLPGSLPASLWGWDISDLAEVIVDGPRRELPDGTTAVEINGRWYRVDADRPDAFMEEVD